MLGQKTQGVSCSALSLGNERKYQQRFLVSTGRSCTIAFAILIVAGCVAGCAVTPKPEGIASLALAPSTEEKRQEGTKYQLQRGDVLDVKFFHTPELNESVTIRPDGKISLQLIGEIDTAGLTPQDLARRLQERCVGILVTPEISVIIRTFAGQKAYVGGEVNRPGLISFDGQLTLLQALIQVGWLKQSAEPRNVVIIRNTGNNLPAVFFVDVLKSIKEPAAPQVLLQPFDVVYVPKSRVATVNDFVEQYLDKIILTPISRVVNFSFIYSLNSLSPGLEKSLR